MINFAPDNNITSQHMKRITVLLLIVTIMTSAFAKGESSPFVQVKDGRFLRDGQPYYYVGTKFKRLVVARLLVNPIIM